MEFLWSLRKWRKSGYSEARKDGDAPSALSGARGMAVFSRAPGWCPFVVAELSGVGVVTFE